MANDRVLRKIRANRRKANAADTELPNLVREAFAAGNTWQQIAKELDVGRARVYQLRAQGSEQ